MLHQSYRLLLFFCTCFIVSCHFSFFFNDTATTEIYTLSLHDALPICRRAWCTWCSGPWRPTGSTGGPRQIGRAHVCTPVTRPYRMPSSARKKKKSATPPNVVGENLLNPTVAVHEFANA